MPFEVKGYVPSIPPGAYQAVCISVEERSPKADPTNVFRVWEFQLTDGSLRTVDGSSSLSTSPKSKAGKWLAALGITPVEGQTVEPEGKLCTIVVALKETTGYEYVETVAPPAANPTQIAVAAAQDGTLTPGHIVNMALTPAQNAEQQHAAQEGDPLPF